MTKKDLQKTSIIQKFKSIEEYAQVDLWNIESRDKVKRWEKAKLANDQLLHSKLSEKGSSAEWFCCWFEVGNIFVTCIVIFC